MGLPRPMSNLGITNTPRFLFAIRDAGRNPNDLQKMCMYVHDREASPSYLVEPSSGQATLKERPRDTTTPGGATAGYSDSWWSDPERATPGYSDSRWSDPR